MSLVTSIPTLPDYAVPIAVYFAYCAFYTVVLGLNILVRR